MQRESLRMVAATVVLGGVLAVAFTVGGRVLLEPADPPTGAPRAGRESDDPAFSARRVDIAEAGNGALPRPSEERPAATAVILPPAPSPLAEDTIADAPAPSVPGPPFVSAPDGQAPSVRRDGGEPRRLLVEVSTDADRTQPRVLERRPGQESARPQSGAQPQSRAPQSSDTVVGLGVGDGPANYRWDLPGIHALAIQRNSRPASGELGRDEPSSPRATTWVLRPSPGPAPPTSVSRDDASARRPSSGSSDARRTNSRTAGKTPSSEASLAAAALAAAGEALEADDRRAPTSGDQGSREDEGAVAWPDGAEPLSSATAVTSGTVGTTSTADTMDTVDRGDTRYRGDTAGATDIAGSSSASTVSAPPPRADSTPETATEKSASLTGRTGQTERRPAKKAAPAVHTSAAARSNTKAPSARPTSTATSGDMKRMATSGSKETKVEGGSTNSKASSAKNQTSGGSKNSKASSAKNQASGGSKNAKAGGGKHAKPGGRAVPGAKSGKRSR